MTSPAVTGGVAERIMLRGKVYQLVSPQDLTLKLLLQLEIETEQLGKRMTLADFERLDEEWKAHKAKGGGIHPAAVWLVGVTVWASRRMAGEEVSFEDAIDFSLDELQEIPSPQDRRKPAARKAAAAPRKARPTKAASGRAGARQAASRTEPQPRSSPESDPASS